MASVEARTKRGPYRAVWRDGGRGSKKHVSEWYGRKGLAQEHADRVESTQAAAKPMRPGTQLSWEDLVRRFLISRADTGEWHKTAVKRTLLTLGKAKGWSSSADPNPSNVEGVKGYAMRFLGALLRYAQGLDQAIDVRVLRVRPKSPRKRAKELLSERHVALLLRWAERYHRPSAELARMIATYGHRAESLIPLTRASLTPAGLRLWVKSGDEHAHPVTGDTRRRLVSLADVPADLFFPQPPGGRWRNGSDYSSWWAQHVPRFLKFPSGRTPGILDLRRYAISRMLAAGHDPKSVASITGHRTVSLLLNTYARTSDERKSSVIAGLELAVSPGVPKK